MSSYPFVRPRRIRRTRVIRDMVQESHLHTTDLVMPYFLIDGRDVRAEVASMPGIYRLSLDNLLKECEKLISLNIPGLVLFPCLEPALKDSKGTEALNENGLYLRAIRQIKKNFPDLCLISDTALDPYSTDGHDGWVNTQGEIDNDATLGLLQKMALVQAEAGADFIGPSDMMDGRISAIRETLEKEGFTQTGILSYAIKYASHFYGPFRDALDSAPKKGDKKTYQLNPANRREALRELELDIDEGADMVMIKPGLAYLDIIHAAREISEVPVAVYNVSGEYAMLRAASEKGWLDYPNVVMETLGAFKRAGADLILSYHALEAATWIKEEQGN